MKRLVVLFALISTSFLFSQETLSEVPKIAIKLPLNETLHLNVGLVTFLEVIEDSRCPKYVNCVWAGRAKVRVSIQKMNNEEAHQREIIIGELLEGETTDRTLFSTEEHIVNAIDLYPLPSSKVDEEHKPYELLVHIEKK
jgi:uncharacterized membrane protein